MGHGSNRGLRVAPGAAGPHNWGVQNDGDPCPVPQAVPDLAGGVTDEDRNRYGVLLDHAAERGLLTPTEYRIRLTALAEATTVEEMQRIVTELPAFAGVPASGGGAGGTDLDAALWAGRTPARSGRRQANQWVVLIAVVAVLVVALIGLALVGAHLAHSHATTPGTGAVGLSPLRP